VGILKCLNEWRWPAMIAEVTKEPGLLHALLRLKKLAELCRYYYRTVAPAIIFSSKHNCSGA